MFTFLIVGLFISCNTLRKKKTNHEIKPVKSWYQFVIYDSALYYSQLSNPKIRIGGTRCSDCDYVIRTDSIVVRYIRSGIEILDTIKNPFE
jgi:hypothetical protein